MDGGDSTEASYYASNMAPPLPRNIIVEVEHAKDK